MLQAHLYDNESSRKLYKKQFLSTVLTYLSNLSKLQANKIPPLTKPWVLTEGDLYFYFSTPIPPEDMDCHPRIKNKIATPKPIKDLYKMFLKCTPKQKYYSALRLLQGWKDKNIVETGCSKLNTVEIIKLKDQ
jgi:hypothetical protein